ncbi:MAG TPA: hypothetical protein DCO89_01640 [Clostridiales bacterium]|nr:hypothetical protein [Clostridiales bacterium]
MWADLLEQDQKTVVKTAVNSFQKKLLGNIKRKRDLTALGKKRESLDGNNSKLCKLKFVWFFVLEQNMVFLNMLLNKRSKASGCSHVVKLFLKHIILNQLNLSKFEKVAQVVTYNLIYF